VKDIQVGPNYGSNTGAAAEAELQDGRSLSGSEWHVAGLPIWTSVPTRARLSLHESCRVMEQFDEGAPRSRNGSEVRLRRHDVEPDSSLSRPCMAGPTFCCIRSSFFVWLDSPYDGSASMCHGTRTAAGVELEEPMRGLREARATPQLPCCCLVYPTAVDDSSEARRLSGLGFVLMPGSASLRGCGLECRSGECSFGGVRLEVRCGRMSWGWGWRRVAGDKARRGAESKGFGLACAWGGDAGQLSGHLGIHPTMAEAVVVAVAAVAAVAVDAGFGSWQAGAPHCPAFFVAMVSPCLVSCEVLVVWLSNSPWGAVPIIARH